MRLPDEISRDRLSPYDPRSSAVEAHMHFAEPQPPTLKKAAQDSGDYQALLGATVIWRRVIDAAGIVATTDASVLLLGETGVGKELVARSIHQLGPRRCHPMVKVNCSAIPPELFESEFFGHVRGAFSGASHDGTLFLDEVGDLPLAMQPKLLRVLQEGEFEAVGDHRTRRVDVRIIAASNQDLRNAIRVGQFREDLFYRLNVFPIEVPPLRERKDDIAILAGAFFESACRRFNRHCSVLTEKQLCQLQDYDWPGNVRELQNVIERAVIAARMGALHFDIGPTAQRGPCDAVQSSSVNGDQIFTDEEMRGRERTNILAALRMSHGKIYGSGGAAELLGVKPSTLNARIKKWGLARR
jgi:transcriptional regulator with GAF, ATPase, and Fis domain